MHDRGLGRWKGKMQRNSGDVPFSCPVGLSIGVEQVG